MIARSNTKKLVGGLLVTNNKRSILNAIYFYYLEFHQKEGIEVIGGVF